MSAIYFAIPTNAGQARIANAIALGIPLKITHMAIGDGNGQPVTPNPAQTSLAREVRRAPLNTLFQDPLNQAQLVAEQIIPEDTGGWWVREVGLYDDSGTLIAVANTPETYKPLLSSGAGRTQTIRMVLIVSDTSAVVLKIDPSVVLATRKYIDDVMKAHTESRNHPDASETEKGFSRHATQAEVNEKGSDNQDAVVTVDKLWGWADQAGGKVPNAFSLWKRSMAEAGYDLIGRFGAANVIESREQVLLSEDGTEVFAWTGVLPKEVTAQSSPIGDDLWVNYTENLLCKKLSSESGAALIGDDVDGSVAIALENIRIKSEDGMNKIDLINKTSFPYKSDGYDVFLVYGQSNAVGYASGSPGFPSVDDRARYWNYQSKQLEVIIPSMKNCSGDVSTGHAWASFANEYIRKTGRNVIIIPCAKGGTAIAGLAKGTPPYLAMSTSLADFDAYALANEIPILSRSLCWHQGETDMSDGTSHNSYISAMDKLLRDIRADFGVGKCFVWRVGCPQNRPETSWYAIQSAQDYVCQSYDWAVMAFSGCGAFTIGSGLLREGVHYTQLGYNVMGQQGAKSVAESLMEENPSSPAELDMYGTMLTSPDHIWRYTYGRAVYEANTQFKLLDISETGYSYRACNIRSIENLTDRLRFNVQSRANYFMGFEATMNKVGHVYGLRAATQVESIGTNLWAIDVYFYKDIEFMLSLDTGNVANPNGSTDSVWPWIQGLISSTQLGSNYYLINHPAAQGAPSLSAFYAENVTEDNVKPVFLTSVTSGSFRVKTFSGLGSKVIVDLKNVNIPLAFLPDSIQVDIQSVVAAKKL
ncbi:phage tail protein [Aeromonas caviae]